MTLQIVINHGVRILAMKREVMVTVGVVMVKNRKIKEFMDIGKSFIQILWLEKEKLLIVRINKKMSISTFR